MENDIDKISEYLAIEISQSNIYSVQDIKSKIKASLALLWTKSDQKGYRKKIAGMQSRLEGRAKHNTLMKAMGEFWKPYALSRMSDEEKIDAFYEIEKLEFEIGHISTVRSREEISKAYYSKLQTDL
ncbi:hypothetical protein [Muricauda sp. MAR_2010_75]|uniref:hypothetical protein n=1 Tax=Allomuricauda sp. MAR_2010_75 TaxID=1250232 RepID=UPI00056BF9BA|nr:hypothetical protein [Muricauda sp. MAR_2010_75]